MPDYEEAQKSVAYSPYNRPIKDRSATTKQGRVTARRRRNKAARQARKRNRK